MVLNPEAVSQQPGLLPLVTLVHNSSLVVITHYSFGCRGFGYILECHCCWLSEFHRSILDSVFLLSAILWHLRFGLQHFLCEDLRKKKQKRRLLLTEGNGFF